MKTIDFTKAGGFPLTQDQLGYMQQAYRESLNALAQVGGSGPIIINGCTVSRALVSGSVYNYTVTDGWVFYQGNMIRVPAGSLAGVNTAVNEVYMLLTPTSAPLTYYDGTTPNVVNDVTGGLQALPIGTAGTTTRFALSSLQPYGREAAETTVNISTPTASGGVSGSIYYRKNFLNNTLQIRGNMGAINAQNFASASLIASYLLCTLPIQYAPKSGGVYFTGEVKFITTTRIKDDLGIGWIERIVLLLNPLGQILAYFQKPDIAVSGYPLEINCIVSLD